jgi:predicted metal-dependent phosphoesterase TrpH
MLDLHTHSRASDGSLTPEELVDLARRSNLAAIALTDHDTVDGLAAGIAAARAGGPELVPGVELSAACERGALHLVGLYIDHEHAGLLAGLERAREMRRARNPRIVEKLHAVGKPLDLTEVEQQAGGDVVGRPHFAQAMVARGHVRSPEEAFERYLARGGAAYVPKQKFDAATCIRLIREAGGVPVLAHPDQTELAGDDLRGLVGRLVDVGLAGLEVYCPSYTDGMTGEYRGIALEYGLVESGGTDFHGSNKPRIELGRGYGRLHVPDELLTRIAIAADEIRKGTR